MLEKFLLNYNKGFHLLVLKELDNFIEDAFATVNLSNMFGEINYARPPLFGNYYERGFITYYRRRNK